MKKHRRQRKRSYLAPLLVLLAFVGASLAYLLLSEPEPRVTAAPAASDSRSPAERTAALPPLKLPADDAAHGSSMEWWYYSGILDAQGGGRYAFHVAVFVTNALVKHTVMHVALTDLHSGKRYTSQSRTGGLPAGQSSGGFDFRQDGWQVAGAGPMHQLRMSFEGVSLSLELRDAAPVVAHRAHDSQTPGLLDFGASGISYYYSRPRMAATGELRLGKQQSAVQLGGPVWFDHQWGEFDVSQLGWNWFALHLSDGSDVMVYELFDQNGRSVTTTGTLTNAQGSRPLAPGEVQLTPLRRWTSPKTQVAYAVAWKLRLPTGELQVRPYFDDSEFDASASSANIYWEGPVKVEGAAQGEGFMELSGYERLKPPAAR
ncbi:MAG TPA: lipocalin family protein [Variovorax sp.]|nr:lipocalin family protein [Variovorax sp.]